MIEKSPETQARRRSNQTTSYTEYQYPDTIFDEGYSHTPSPGAPVEFGGDLIDYPHTELYESFAPPETSLLKFSNADAENAVSEFVNYDNFFQPDPAKNYLMQFNVVNKDPQEPKTPFNFNWKVSAEEKYNKQLLEYNQQFKAFGEQLAEAEPQGPITNYNQLNQQQISYNQQIQFHQHQNINNPQFHQINNPQIHHNYTVVQYNPKIHKQLAPALGPKSSSFAFPRKPRRRTGPYKRNELYALLSVPSNFVTPASLADLRPKVIYYFPNVNVYLPSALKHDPHAILKLLNFPIGSYSQSVYRDGNGEFLLRQARCKGGKVCLKCNATYGSKKLVCDRGCKKKLRKLACSITVYYLYPKDTSGAVSSRLLAMLPDVGDEGHSHELDN